MNIWQFLQWCLQDFWHWLGLFLLVTIIAVSVSDAFSSAIRALRK